MSSQYQSLNKWGEPVYRVPFAGHRDALNFTKFIGRNFTKFALVGCHRTHHSAWVVVYRARKTSPWAEGGAA